MMSGGEALETYALQRARSSLSALAERAPRTAHIWQGEELLTIPAEHITVGMEIVVKPGELVPVDGVITTGNSSLSEADLTGEPLPVRKSPGMLVLSGSVNLDGVIEVRANKLSAESHYAQIVRLVETAQSHKAPIHRLADRYSLWFTLAALILAGLAWIISGDRVYALAVLVVATPCPLILATPIAIMSGIDLAARNGIIAKSGAAIEQLGTVDIAIFDKTGTLTLGKPQVTAIILVQPGTCPANAEQLLLRLAASIEQLSTHILARAIVEAAQTHISRESRDAHESLITAAVDFTESFGQGVRGIVPLCPSEGPADWPVTGDTVEVAVGNRKFMRQQNIVIPETLLAEREERVNAGQMCSFIAVAGQVQGMLVLVDVPRADLAELSRNLHRAGIKEILLLTGDNEIVAEHIGKLAQVDQVLARCLPKDKVRAVQDLVTAGHHVLMVGDGINDAPALASASVGMALGAQGLTAAASAADTILLSTDILRVPRAVHLGRQVMRVAQQGIWVGMGLSGIAMLCAAFGLIPPATGALLQEEVSMSWSSSTHSALGKSPSNPANTPAILRI